MSSAAGVLDPVTALRDALNRLQLEGCVEELGPNESLFPDRYVYFPERNNQQSAFLGKGSFGTVYRALPKGAKGDEPVRAVKLLRKEHDGTHNGIIRRNDPNRTAIEIKHVMMEIDVLLHAAEREIPIPYVNKMAPAPRTNEEEKKRFVVYHDKDFIYLVLEMANYSPHLGLLLDRQFSDIEIRDQFIHALSRFTPNCAELKELVQSGPDSLNLLVEKQKQDPMALNQVVSGFERVKWASESKGGFGDLKKGILSPCRLVGTQLDLFQLCWSHCRTSAVPELKAKIIIQQVLMGLADLHQDGFVHRDLKPRNILLGESRTVDAAAERGKIVITEKLDVNIIDFGLGKRINKSAPNIRVTKYPWPKYLPLEVQREVEYESDNENLKKIDVYLAGMTLYTLLNFSQHNDPHLTPTFYPSCSKAAQAFILKLMHPNPKERPTVAEALGIATDSPNNLEYLRTLPDVLYCDSYSYTVAPLDEALPIQDERAFDSEESSNPATAASTPMMTTEDLSLNADCFEAAPRGMTEQDEALGANIREAEDKGQVPMDRGGEDEDD